MRKILFLLVICLFTIFSTYAADGDTLIIQSHQETHWSWDGRYTDTVQFPTNQTFQKIRMHYVLGCPTGGCSEWDYKTNIELWNPINDSTIDEYELARVITPYAGDKNNGWFHEYIFDVTDYSSLLTGEKIIMAYYGGYQDGFTITIWFEFIEGTPPREALNVQKIYRSGSGGFLYGYSSDPIEDHLTNRTMNLDPLTKEAKFRLVATGHGFGNSTGGNPDNCVEFCPKWFRLMVNGTQEYNATVWKDDCGAEANVGQTGTWIYNRAGWCPGSEAQVFDYELTPHLTGNNVDLDVNWQPYNYTGGAGFPIHYWLESHLIEYGEKNYTVEAEISQILRPTSYDRQSKHNPTCANPIIEVKNNGASKITKLAILYGVTGGKSIRSEFLVDLDFDETTEIELPIPPQNFYKGSGKKFFAELVYVNGSADENLTNNRVESSFEVTPKITSKTVLQFRTNNNASENKYSLVNANGNVIVSRDNMSPTTVYNDTLDLAKGCYTLYIEDSGDDGLSWWANPGQGSGSVRMTNVNLGTNDSLYAISIDPDFGSFTKYIFTVGYHMNAGNDDFDESTWQNPNPITGVSEWKNLDDAIISIYPNPTASNVQIELFGYRGNADVEIFDATGRLVLTQQIYSDGVSPNSLKTQPLPNGIYQARIKIENEYYFRRILKQ